ncbi:hypothetical protein OG279_35060 [Streptomyces sp. NBC_01201]|uniref:Uncharacterized protein n=1 Tax=Streptomyces glycanivorans TaxID=3033808 RepID=A0ABY9JN37_9ACTN|nr:MULTISPECIES: hypothetical protein [unclassified Streptomyces]WSQ82522.1 hypothetical protein OG725_34070 [Streptomyces sp. NBC_01213]WSQ89842.1 hypothetical protein OG722_34465 [Streptomyces sp. NBC_01212]WSR53191.1 hypothetical protein OG279_35060 [Streptomyces sp. NBC_01201]WLQ69138.1 hypothetical protein P8A20_35065 [Streptomyces sp. Alt3]WSR11179.1 hypothetical protein OG265_02035 [Streptomyces sp. NBC_01208]
MDHRLVEGLWAHDDSRIDVRSAYRVA